MPRQLTVPPTPTTPLPMEDELGKRVALYLAHARHELGAIEVEADNGVARLSGLVSSFYLRQLAVACAKRVAGVRAVIDNLRVRHPLQSVHRH